MFGLTPSHLSKRLLQKSAKTKYIVFLNFPNITIMMKKIILEDSDN